MLKFWTVITFNIWSLLSVFVKAIWFYISAIKIHNLPLLGYYMRRKFFMISITKVPFFLFSLVLTIPASRRLCNMKKRLIKANIHFGSETLHRKKPHFTLRKNHRITFLQHFTFFLAKRGNFEKCNWSLWAREDPFLIIKKEMFCIISSRII